MALSFVSQGFLEAQLAENLPAMWETWVRFLVVGKILREGERLPTPVFWPGDFHGLYSPWGHRESDMTEPPSLLSPVLWRPFLWLVLLLAFQDDHLGNQGRRGQYRSNALGNLGLRLEFCWECKNTHCRCVAIEACLTLLGAKQVPAGWDQAQFHLPGQQLCH